MKRNKGIMIILVGIGLMLMSFFCASGYIPRLGYLGSLSRMDIVLSQGDFISGPGFSALEQSSNGHWEGRVEIPLKVGLSISVILMLAGTGIILISSNDKQEPE